MQALRLADQNVEEVRLTFAYARTSFTEDLNDVARLYDGQCRARVYLKKLIRSEYRGMTEELTPSARVAVYIAGFIRVAISWYAAEITTWASGANESRRPIDSMVKGSFSEGKVLLCWVHRASISTTPLKMI